MSLRNLIEEAYGVTGFQILGGSTWSNSDVYDNEAKAEHTTSKAQLLLTLQSLLTDRFKLIAHRERKEIPVCTLLVGESGSKLKEASYDGKVVGRYQRLTHPTHPVTRNDAEDGFRRKVNKHLQSHRRLRKRR